jgi:hypothetical protein
LPGFAVSLYAQRAYGAKAAYYDRACVHDARVVAYVINLMADSPEERRRLRAQVEAEAREFVDLYWREIERLGDEIYRHGKLNREQIERVLAPPTVKTTTSTGELSGMPPRVAAAFRAAATAIAGIRRGLTVGELWIDERGNGRCRMLGSNNPTMQWLVERAGQVAREGDPDWPLISRLAKLVYQRGGIDHWDAIDCLPELARQAA